MKKLIFISVFFIIGVFSAFAVDNVSVLKDKFFKMIDNVSTMTADFSQITDIKDVGEDIYTGKMYLISKKKVLWDYYKPYVQYYIFTPTSMDYYDSSMEQLIKRRVTQSGGENIIFNLLVDFSTAKNEFDIQIIDNNTIKMLPKDDIGLKYLEVTFNEKFIQEIESIDESGNSTRVYLKNIILNKPIDEQIFNKQVPPETEIIEQ